MNDMHFDVEGAPATPKKGKAIQISRAIEQSVGGSSGCIS